MLMGVGSTPLADTGLSHECRIEAEARPQPTPEMVAELEEARAALHRDVTKRDIAELKSFIAVSRSVALVMDAALSLFGEEELGWVAAKRIILRGESRSGGQWRGRCSPNSQCHESPASWRELPRADPEEMYDHLSKEGFARARAKVEALTEQHSEASASRTSAVLPPLFRWIMVVWGYYEFYLRH
eukprot:Hpha_TRINITY_DN22629_c0_g1::TRINITY_DN22629_c0_g1_i1::g.192765::m.192765